MNRHFGSLCAAALAGLLGFGTAASGAVMLNEIRIDQPGADDDEYFELAGTPSESLDGLSYIIIGDGTGGSGTVESVLSLSGQSIPASGYFLVAESTWTGTFGSVTPHLTASVNFENSDNVTHLLVSNFTGADGDDLDTNDDGVLDSTPWSSIIDSVALSENVPSEDLVYSPTIVGPDGTFVPGHVYRAFDGTEWAIGLFGGGDDTPGAPNVPEPAGAALLALASCAALRRRRRHARR